LLVNLQREFTNLTTSVPSLQLLCKLTNTVTSTALTPEMDLSMCTHFMHPSMLWHEPRLTNKCAWSWGLYGINPAIALQNMTMQLTDARPSNIWFIQTALLWFVTPCRVTDGCQCYGGTHCLHLRGL